MVAEELFTDSAECRLDRGDLREHIDAVPVIFDHLSDAPHLSLDAFEPCQVTGSIVITSPCLLLIAFFITHTPLGYISVSGLSSECIRFESNS